MAHQSDLIAEDIQAYLHQHEHKSLLRFLTCGSVDDGKSTLIGRLLYDSKMIFEDQLAALEADSKRVGTQGGEIDFALLVDGLAAAGVTAENGKKDMSFIAEQVGMFSYSGLSKEQMVELREKHGVYGTDKGRICVAALNDSNIDYVCQAIAAVM